METAQTLRERTRTDSPASPRSEGAERRTTAWIGQGVVVEGKISSSQDLRIDGKVEGTIEVGNHVLTVGAGAAVKANLVAKSILISGAVIGNVTATVRIDLHATGSVEGDVSAPRLLMVDGAVINGKVTTGNGRKTKPQGD